MSYAGSPTDFTYRRMVLHYANLCIVAGGVDLFLVGTEFRGLETIRGPGWTIAGTVDGAGKAIWDYPFVAGMIALATDVRNVFDTAGFTKDTTGLHNLISYAADWSDLMGWQHPGANPPTGVPGGAQWPHLDQLWAHNNIDLVCFDNYMPMSDWTTGFGSSLIERPSGQPRYSELERAGRDRSSVRLSIGRRRSCGLDRRLRARIGSDDRMRPPITESSRLPRLAAAGVDHGQSRADRDADA